MQWVVLRISPILLLLIGSCWAETTPDFVHDVAPILSRFGCNGSACHGKAEGQNGFKLSVFGFDPDGDYAALTQQARGRRVMLGAPEQSLMLAKATGELPHEGGVQMEVGSRPYQLLTKWIEAGAPFDLGDERNVVSLRLEPNREVVKFEEERQLKAIATFENGQEEDVTWLAEFHANEPGMADVDEHGAVKIGSVVGQAAVMARFQGQVAVFQAMIPRPAVEDDDPFPSRPVNNAIDELVDKNLRELNLHPSELCDDPAFLRRVYLDLIGRLPTPDETRAFLAEPDRTKLVDELLERDEYADLMALRWADLLRVERSVLGHRDAFAYYSWIREAMAENKPLDQFVDELLTASGPLNQAPAGHFYRVAKAGENAATAAQVFLGVRITCAECHQHPYDQWTQQDYHGLRAYFEVPKPKKITETQFALASTGKPTVKHPRTGDPIYAHPLGETMPEEAA
ncbi:MAG: DUF1549 domain-containing protein, partial [Verrucomicrobiota bacterium]